MTSSSLHTVLCHKSAAQPASDDAVHEQTVRQISSVYMSGEPMILRWRGSARKRDNEAWNGGGGGGFLGRRSKVPSLSARGLAERALSAPPVGSASKFYYIPVTGRRPLMKLALAFLLFLIRPVRALTQSTASVYICTSNEHVCCTSVSDFKTNKNI